MAFIALCVALFSLGGATAYAVNTVRSTDIVDGQVLTQDLGNNAVTTAKIKDGQVTNPDIAANSVGSGKIIDNNITGADVNESTLGRVPDAAKLNGHASNEFHVEQRASTAWTGDCSTNQVWTECAPTPVVTVPAGHTYSITVTSTVTMSPSSAGGSTQVCAATAGPTCIYGYPEMLSPSATQYTNGTYTATHSYPAGSYTFSTAIKTPTTVSPEVYARTVTTVLITDEALAGIG